MARSFNTLRRTGTTVPRVQELQYEPGQVFVAHSLVVLNANGNVILCVGSPASVTGVALNGVGTKPGYNLPNANVTGVVTGLESKVSVAIADKEQEFSARGVNGGTDPVIPLQNMIGLQYGVLKTAANDWVIDFSNTTTKVVQITDIFPDKNFFACKFLDAVMNIP